MAVAKSRATEKCYDMLNTQGGTTKVYKIARAKKQERNDIQGIRGTKGKTGEILEKEAEVRNR